MGIGAPARARPDPPTWQGRPKVQPRTGHTCGHAGASAPALGRGRAGVKNAAETKGNRDESLSGDSSVSDDRALSLAHAETKKVIKF